MKNRIAFFRKKKGLTQEALAQQVGISRPYLSDIENEKVEPGGLVVLKISKSLGKPVEKIFIDSVNHNVQTEPEQALSS